jgi:uncharacterized membrane protein
MTWPRPPQLPSGRWATGRTRRRAGRVTSVGTPSGRGVSLDRGGIAMATFEESIDVKVPVRTAYDQWTQFESFPQFMEGVEEVRQISDTKLAWRAEIAGRTESWDAEITEQTPDQRIAWTSRSGAKNAGVVARSRRCA